MNCGRNMSYIFVNFLSLTIIVDTAIGRPVVINKFSTVHYMNVLLGIPVYSNSAVLL